MTLKFKSINKKCKTSRKRKSIGIYSTNRMQNSAVIGKEQLGQINGNFDKDKNKFL